LPDIGDVYRISTTVTDTAGDLVNAATAVLTVTAPDGTTSTPAVTNPSAGTYHADVTIDAAGRWLWRWATTTPTGVEHGHIDVPVDPPARLLPLATIEDLESRIGTLSPAQVARVPALLADASAAIRRFCRQDFDLVTGDVVTLRPVGTHLRLPRRPVAAVSSVVAIGGGNGLADVALSAWTFDGIDLVNVWGLGDVVLNLPEWWNDLDGGTNSYRVTYSHGFPTTPPEIVGKVCQMVNRVLTAGSLTEGQTQMTVGQYSEQWQQGTGSIGLTPVLTKADRDDLILWGYRRTAGTIQTHRR
jgi:hypothetical protein